MERSENEVICCDKCNKAFEQGETFEVLLIKIDDRFREVRFHRQCSPLKFPDWVSEWDRGYKQAFSIPPITPSYPQSPITITPYNPSWGGSSYNSNGANQAPQAMQGSQAMNVTATELAMKQQESRLRLTQQFKDLGLNSKAIGELLMEDDEDKKS
jgi:hypothetical protein